MMRRLRKRSHRRALPQSCDVVRLAAKSMRVRSIGKVRATVVPVPSSDETRRPRPILSQATAARCSPMPVALWCVRPRLPVKPRSNTRGTSAAGMPSPSSLIASSMQPSFVPASFTVLSNRMVFAPYFAEFSRTWPMMKSVHFASVSTLSSSSMANSSETPAPMSVRDRWRHALRAMAARLSSSMEKSSLSVAERA